MAPSLKIGKAITEVIGRTGIKCFAIAAPPETKFPFIVYRRTGTQPVSSKDVQYGLTIASYEVTVASDQYVASLSIAEDVIRQLLSMKGPMDEVDVANVTVDSTSEDLSSDAWVQNISLTIKYQ